jgi:serine/threonine-protein kinase
MTTPPASGAASNQPPLSRDAARLSAALAERYRIERELGAGGMATVYLAEDLRHHREVALKVLKPELGESLGSERFLREIEIAARLTHPHILALYDSGEAAGVLYYVMPYVHGESLRSRLTREGELPVSDACRILRDVADALAAAHREGIVHRDIKPENILLTGGHALVADFGVAKAVSEAAMRGATFTTAGMAVGTPAYMAPEQAAGDSHLDARADIYALGVVAYEMLTGRAPFAGTTPQQVLAAQVSETPEPVTKRRASIPPSLAGLVMQCLEKHPADRPRSAEAVLAVLEQIPSGAAPAVPAALAASTPRSLRGALAGTWRRWVPYAVAALILAGAIAFVATRGGRSWRDGAASGGDDSVHSIAVLPFLSLGGDTAGAYFGDGVSEEILTSLSRLPGLAVVGRTSSFRFRGSDIDAKKVGRALDASALLAGTIQRSGDAVRITAELVDTRTGLQLWSQTYDRRMRDLFSLEDEIARAITDTLRVRLGDAPIVHRGTTSPEAHDLVLHANALALKNDEASLDSSVSLYQRAIALDSTYAEAWARLSLAYGGLADAYRAPREMIAPAEHAALRAIEMDDSLALAHVALGVVRLDWQWRFAGARHEFLRALALDPGSPDAHMNYAVYLLWVDDDADGAERELDSAAARDPLNPDIVRWQETAAMALGQTDRALQLARRIRELAGGPVYYGYNRLTQVYARAGRWKECVRAADSATTSSATPDVYVAICSVHLGDRARAQRVLAQLEAREYPDRVWVASILVALGDTARALSSLEEAFVDRSANLPTVRSDPLFAPLRDSPRFKTLFERIGLPLHGPPAGVREP